MTKNIPTVPSSVVAAMKAFEKAAKINPRVFPVLDKTAFSKVSEDALRIFPAIHSQLAEQLKPWTELQQQIRVAVQPLQQEIARVTESARRAAAYFESFKPSPEFQRLAQALMVAEQRRHALDSIGLLPHASTPFEVLDEDNQGLRERIEGYYRDNWDGISQAIQKRAEAFNIDLEAKETLIEALNAHKDGYYRSTCRLLLPEIERVARLELQRKELGFTKVDKVLGEPAGSLSLRDTNPPGYFALHLYERLKDHLYAHVDASNIARLRDDPVPNRHAAIHGFVTYKTVWHSLNAIFMTDYAFQIVTAVKAAALEEQRHSTQAHAPRQV